MHVALFLLLTLLMRPPLGESLDNLSARNRPKLTGEQPGTAKWESTKPCPGKQTSLVRMPVLSLLWKRKEPEAPLWPDAHPSGSRVIPALEGALLVEREKDLSTYNWNSFGLRYGKRQDNEATNTRGKRC
ncbi:hypothetical protein NDU88_004455 [Pleurodeles waltl]|uniref:Kisspeptin n=1 Tax=Pleurodeles waltl TaxID=8319 RepID=A0AAV7QG78_PLEWA|nr:hypothetical protein NDU88_004455 [Pleurodeles waltl]